MKNILSILDSGLITAGGNSLETLLPESEWLRVSLPRLGNNAAKTTRIVPIDPLSLSHWRKEPRFRRATPISLFLVEAISQITQKLPSTDEIGLIVVTFTGSITYSRKFFQETIEQGPRAASPMMFPETVFNSPTSHVVSQLQIGGPVYTILGDESAWISGLETASLWLQLGKAKSVIVAAAYEIDAMAVEAYHTAGWIKKGLIPTEGAAAILLNNSSESLITEKKNTIQIDLLKQGYLYKSRSDFKTESHRLQTDLGKTPLLPPPWSPWITERKSTTPPRLHGFPFSAALKTIQAAQEIPLHTTQALPIYGCNHQAGFIRLHRAN